MIHATTLSLAFLMALAISITLRIWLAWRQFRHVAGHRGVVPFEFASSVPLKDHRKAADYTLAKTALNLMSYFVEVLLLLALTAGGLLNQIDIFWFDVFGERGNGHGLALFASTAAISLCLDLPFSLYRTFGLEARFGFNKMAWKTAISDILKQVALTVAIGGPLLLAVLWLMAAMGNSWWLYTWMSWLAFNMLIMLVYPTLIAPLFNKFTPLPEGDLKSRIGTLLARCGFTASGLYIMDGSRRSAHGNAYFTGLGRAKRIVFFDTLIDKLKPAEVEAVLAHELGHFKHHHVWQRMIVMAIISLALLWALGKLMAASWFYQGLGVSTPSTAMALMLFSMVVPIFLFPLTPLGSLLSRRHEYQADVYAASHADVGALISALISLYRDNAATLTPDPIHSLFYDSHPPASLRIAHLNSLS